MHSGVAYTPSKTVRYAPLVLFPVLAQTVAVKWVPLAT